MSCDVPSCDEMSSVVKWRDALGWGLPSLWCDVAGCDVTLCGSKWLCDVGNWKMIWSVLQRNTSTTQYYKALLRTTQFYKVLLRTSQHYKLRQCTTLHYTVLQSVLQSTTTYYKVLLQSMTPYYKILQRYYSIRQSINLFDRRNTWNAQYTARSNRSHLRISPNFAPATKNDSNDWSSRQIKRHLHCAEQHVSPSNLAKYCACHQKWLMIGPPHLWKVIYIARSTKTHPPTSPNIVPATKNDSHDWSCSHLKRQ